MLINGNALFLAGGNAASPGAFNRQTGECWTGAPNWVGTNAPRGRELALREDGAVLVSGQPLYSTPENPVYDNSAAWTEMVVRAANATLRLEQAGDKGPWRLVARTLDDQPLWTKQLPAEPVRWGIAVAADGRILIALRTGEVLCFG
jgi:hypothetical protein